MRQFSLTATIALSVCFCSAGVRGETERNSKGPQTLKVLAYNIHMWQPGVKQLASNIRASGADIVGLNEAWTGKKNVELAKALGYRVVFGGQDTPPPAKRRSHSINRHYMPQVLLTRHKIVEHKHFNAMAVSKETDPKEKPDFDPAVPIYRGGTLAVLETARGHRVVVFVLHLHPWGGADNERMTTMRLNEIKGIVAKLKPYADLPTLVIGDFNTRSHLDGKAGWKVTRYLDKQGFSDLYRTVRPDAKADPGLTCGDGRIDYIFYNKHVKPVSAHVMTQGVFGSRGYDQSDHLGVFGEVEVGR